MSGCRCFGFVVMIDDSEWIVVVNVVVGGIVVVMSLGVWILFAAGGCGV